jgi:hypothetical protein
MSEPGRNGQTVGRSRSCTRRPSCPSSERPIRSDAKLRGRPRLTEACRSQGRREGQQTRSGVRRPSPSQTVKEAHGSRETLAGAPLSLDESVVAEHLPEATRTHRDVATAVNYRTEGHARWISPYAFRSLRAASVLYGNRSSPSVDALVPMVGSGASTFRCGA